MSLRCVEPTPRRLADIGADPYCATAGEILWLVQQVGEPPRGTRGRPPPRLKDQRPPLPAAVRAEAVALFYAGKMSVEAIADRYGANVRSVKYHVDWAEWPQPKGEASAGLHPLGRLQIALWLPAECVVCHMPYRDVDDFLERDPRAGHEFGKGSSSGPFVDDACFAAYEGEASAGRG